MSRSSGFAPPESADAVENGTTLTPRFDANGLVLAIAADVETGEILMVAYMNAEALARTIETGTACFYSRSRQKLWVKGEESGNTLEVREIRVDCDQDAILLKVHVAGNGVACHQGYRSCFYRTVPVGAPVAAEAALELDRNMKRVERK